MGEKEEMRHRAMTLVLLERKMTATAFDAYLEADPELDVLAGLLGDGVDGDLLIGLIQDSGKPDAAVLKSYFQEGAPIGTIA